MTAQPAIHVQSDFWKFWVGQTISQLGSSLAAFALPLLVFKLTGSALNLGIASAASFLPYLLFGLLIGAWVDRANRKRLMISVDVARAAVIALIPLFDALGALNVWWVYGISFVSTTLTIFFESSEFAALPSLVGQDDLVTANGRIQASYSGAAVAGPLLAGLLIALMPIADLLLLDAASFLASAVSLALIRRSFNQARDETRQPSTLREDVREGLRYVLGHPVLRNISLMMALVNLVGSSVGAQVVLFAKTRYAASDSQIGLLFSAGSIGVVVLSLFAGAFRKRWSFSRVALGALCMGGFLTLIFAITPWYWAGVVVWALLSGSGILFNINTGSLRQAIVPNHMLGRVMSIAGVLAWSAIPLGTLAGGWIIERSNNVALVYAVIGILQMILPLAFSFTALGHAERYLPAQEPEAVV